MLRLKRAQRAILKVMFNKPQRYSTFDMYKECLVLTVRKVFILKVVLQSHLFAHITHLLPFVEIHAYASLNVIEQNKMFMLLLKPWGHVS